MGRKTVIRSLPALKTFFPRFKGFAPDQHQIASLAELLRKPARALQRDAPHPFYAMREVARFFAMPLSSVAQVYQRLAAEGLLTRIHGAMTLVAGRRLRARADVRAVVGVPVWWDGFAILQEWPPFHAGLEAALWRYNVLTNFIFFKHDQQMDPSFAERLLAHKLDFVIWPVPPAGALHTMQLLTDAGVRLIVLGDGTWTFPGQQYLLSWDQGLADGIDAWKKAGIASVVISRPPPDSGLNRVHSSHDALLLQQTLTLKRIPHSFSEPSDADLARYVQQLIRKPDAAAAIPLSGTGQAAGEVGVIIVNYFWIAKLLRQALPAMIQLMKTRRVMLSRIPANVVNIRFGDAQADLISMDWQGVVRRVAKDLAAQRSFQLNTPLVFAAQWAPQVKLSQFASEIHSEESVQKECRIGHEASAEGAWR
ncbi:MAG: hypothetical protein HY360_04215 [Verrucomicrobia bacterium]|nr:hypothetical protein [Verrucomicrobiota bacterium]